MHPRGFSLCKSDSATMWIWVCINWINPPWWFQSVNKISPLWRKILICLSDGEKARGTSNYLDGLSPWHNRDNNTYLIHNTGDHLRWQTMAAYVYQHSTWWWWFVDTFLCICFRFLVYEPIFASVVDSNTVHSPSDGKLWSFLQCSVQHLCPEWRFVDFMLF